MKTVLLLKLLLCFVVILSALISCDTEQFLNDKDVKKVNSEVRQMLNNYYSGVNEEGLMAEFKYLDNSTDFFWIPPGYQSALSYDSVRAEVQRNARFFQSVHFRWDTLRVVPLSENIANYLGLVSGSMTDTTGIQSVFFLLESGTVIRRTNGWKILSGHTTRLH